MVSPFERIQVLNPLEQTGWDDYIISHPDHCFFHTAAWAEVLHNAYGFTPRYISVQGGTGGPALVPIMEIRSRLTGKRGVSLPFTDECPWLVAESLNLQVIIHEVVEYGNQREWKYFESRCNWPFSQDVRPSVTYLGHALALTKGEDGLFSAFEGSVRRAIRKAESAKVEVEISNTVESVRIFYKLHCGTRRKHGLPPQPFAFFENVFRSILSKSMGFVAVARQGEKPVAAAMFFHLGRKALYKFGASDYSLQQLRGNNLVMWEAVKWYCRNGYTWLDLGRTAPANEGLRRYKLGFGADERQIEYHKYDFRKRSFVSGPGEVFGWINRFFRLMPVPISRMIAALFYRHWA